MTFSVTEVEVGGCVSASKESRAVEGMLHSWEEGELLSLAFLPGKLLNQMEIRTGRELNALT